MCRACRTIPNPTTHSLYVTAAPIPIPKSLSFPGTALDAYGTVKGNQYSYSCLDNPCVASSSTSDDGSDGNFYCINGGNIGGFTGLCSCTSCNTGFGGPNCATCPEGYSGSPPLCSPDPCQASSTSTDDGSDGNFYCINGGDIGGTTGSCTAITTVSSVEYAVTDMETLFNKMSNEAAYPNGFSAYQGNDIIDYLGGKKTTEKHRTQHLSTTSSPTHFPNQLNSLPTQARTRSFWHR